MRSNGGLSFGFATAPIHCPEAEIAVLGALIVCPEARARIGALHPECFCNLQHRHAFEVVTAWLAAGEHVGPVTLRAPFEGDPDLGLELLAGLAEHAATPINAGEYANELRRLRHLRHLDDIALDIQTFVRQSGPDEDPAAYVSAKLSELSVIEVGHIAPAISTFEDLTMQPRTFLWRPYLPDGGYCLVAGRGESGKTTFATALHAWASTGRFPDHQREPVRSLIIEKQDDDGDEIKPKLIANGYDPRMVIRLVEKKMPTFEELEALIVEHQLGLVTMSPLNAFVAQYVKSLNDDLTVEPILDRLHVLGVRRTCLINGIKHLNKKPDLASDQRIAGAGGFVNSARTAIMVAYDRANDVRLVETIKASRGLVGSWRMTFTDVGQDAAPKNPTAFVKATLTPAEPGDSIDSMLAPKNGLTGQAHEVVDFFAERRGDYSYKEVAKTLGRPEATTKTQLNRMANRGHISRGGCDRTFRRKELGNSPVTAWW